jgi:hypothetical protein
MYTMEYYLAIWKHENPSFAVKWMEMKDNIKKEKKPNKEKQVAGRQWLMPVILATQETEIRRIMV